MISMMDKKTFNRIRDGVSEGMGAAWKEARKQAGRMELRSPVTYAKPSGAKPWMIGALILSAGAAILAGWFYVRSRRAVSAGTKESEGDINGSTVDFPVREGLLADRR